MTSPADYQGILDEIRSSNGVLSTDTHWSLAKQAFPLTASYDRAVSARLAEIPPTGEPLPATLDIRHPTKDGASLRRESASVRRAIFRRQAGSPQPSSCRARSFLTTIWWI